MQDTIEKQGFSTQIIEVSFLDKIKDFTLQPKEELQGNLFEIAAINNQQDLDKTSIEEVDIGNIKTKKYLNEFWTPKQRQANSIHEISYRACFKPQLPRFFIEKLTKEGDYVYDPFSGRGTTIIEAALLNRQIIGNDINPLARILSEGRLLIPDLLEVKKYLDKIPVNYSLKADIDLSMFYHSKTESEIVSIKNFILEKEKNNSLNSLDKWIRMVATNRLTGHSKGFFSIYSMPPNQAVTPDRQIKINEKLNQTPDYRNVKELILVKSKALIKDISIYKKQSLEKIYKTAIFLNNNARKTPEVHDNFVQLTVTSPPFLNIVHYTSDNWLRCWFNGIHTKEIKITMSKKTSEWTALMQEVFIELFRITKKGGYVAFEVGEIRNGKIKLDEHALPLGIKAGFRLIGIIINEQKFTKTSNIWGIKNNKKGTNSNRIVLFIKE